jgi:hypothetical protein
MDKRTPLRLSSWTALLVSYPDREQANFIIRTLERGADIRFRGNTRRSDTPSNLKTAAQHKEHVTAYIKEEVALGRMLGPFAEPPFEFFRTSPVGVVPKDHTKFRVINHLSFPRTGDSINSDLEPLECNLGSFDEAIKLVKMAGPGSNLIKVDVKSAFRLIPVRREDINLLGVEWQGKYYVDICLPFGLATSPPIWERFSRVLRWALQHVAGIKLVTHYVDDFFIVVPKQEGDAEVTMKKALALFEWLGVPYSPAKLLGPATSMPYLGIGIDTDRMVTFVTPDKLNAIIDLLHSVLESSHIQRTQLQAVLGKLYFLTRILPQGRAFLRRGISMLYGKKTARISSIPMSEGFRKDLAWWLRFLPRWDGLSMFFDAEPAADAPTIYTDASLLAAGASFDNHWFAYPWQATHKADAMRIKRISMPYLELLAVLLALNTWASELRGQVVRLCCDCKPMVQAIRKLSSPEPHVMHLLRCLVLLCIEKQILLHAQHISTEENSIADSLSRQEMQHFRLARPNSNQNPTPVKEWSPSDFD